MMVFTRKNNESVILGGPSDFERVLKVTVLEIKPDRVKLSIDVRDDPSDGRWEVWERIRAHGASNP